MRSLHLIKTSVGGMWAHRMAAELVRCGEEVHIALPPGGKLISMYRDAGVTVHECDVSLKPSKPLASREAMQRLVSLVRSVRPDIIHSHNVATTLAMRFALRNRFPIPRVFQVPGPLHLEHSLYRAIDIHSATKLDYWVGSCNWTVERYIKSGIRPERVFLSYYGTDTAVFSSIQQGSLKAELESGSDESLVGMIAHIYPPKHYLGQFRGLKGHEDFIDAMRIVNGESNRKVRGVIVGGAWNGAVWYEQALREYARRRCGDKMIFLGHRSDVANIYADLDCAVHPSHSENLGGAAESQLAGVPTIATRVGGFPDIVENGKTGWLVPPKNPAMLAAAILDAISDPSKATRFAEAGRRQAMSQLDVKKTAGEIREIYSKVIGSQ